MSASLPPRSILDSLNVHPVLNASGIYTDLGGSIMSPAIMAAWAELNQSWVRMTELLDATGAHAAQLLGVPAARIVPSASAGLALSAAACIAGGDGALWERLPDTDGIPAEILCQQEQLASYKYAMCSRLSGARLRGVAADALDQAIGPDTVGLLHVAHLDGKAGSLPLEAVAEVGRRHGIPVMVDAAYYNFPILPDPADPALASAARDTMRSWHVRGGDLVCFSAKYFWGPNAGGLVMGRSDLVGHVTGLDFTRFESGEWKAFGRAFKMGRFEVVGTAVALETWLTLDHAARLRTYRRQVDRLTAALSGIAGLQARPLFFTLDEEWHWAADAASPVNAVALSLESGAAMDIATLGTRLAALSPRILPFVENDVMAVVVETLRQGDELRVADAVRAVLEG